MISMEGSAEGPPARKHDTTTITAGGATAPLAPATDGDPAVWPHLLLPGWSWVTEPDGPGVSAQEMP